jgi:hypothetical protein
MEYADFFQRHGRKRRKYTVEERGNLKKLLLCCLGCVLLGALAGAMVVVCWLIWA